ncbi:gluconate 2-dehydrogenase subunit 3 family protein [Prosthecomicrobium sp. N25]|uniref:gluconate 2-dehydrogenase subunit 3 family protein n=1 Tax=Prosthecomicrobium sp. N25 TaxID=3129254 RepID=UPI003076BC2D
MSETLSRRDLFKVAGAAGAAAAAGPAAAQTQPPVAEPADGDRVLFFFTDPEARFVEAAAERLIPKDPRWPGAADAGVLFFIDRQLASAWGAGDRMYLKGPWKPEAAPEQGYQLRFTPAELYRIAIGEIGEHCRQAYGGKEFWDLGEPVMDEVLGKLETGGIALPSLPSAVFFETLLANTIEGFFADPAYGGNRGMAGWRMVGFPGAYAQFVDLVDVHGHEYRREPIGIGNTAAREAHLKAHASHMPAPTGAGRP